MAKIGRPKAELVVTEVERTALVRLTKRAHVNRLLAFRARLALNGLVNVELETNTLVSARSRLDVFLARTPTSPEALMLLAQIEVMGRNTSKAEQTLRKVIELHPANLDAYSALGTLYLAQNKLEEARAEFINVTREQPQSVGAHTLVGILCERLGEPTEAERWYKQTLQIDPQAAVAANNLAWIYAEQDRNLDTAVQLAQIASAASPNRPDVSDTLGWTYFKAGLTSTAISLFLQSIDRNPRNAVYHYHLGMAYIKDQDLERAKASLQRALDLNPSFEGVSEARKALASLN